MSETINLIRKTIEDIEFELQTAMFFQVSRLYINGVPFYVQDVDLAQVIRAIVKYDTLYFIRDGFKGVWGEEKIISHITSILNGDY